MTTNSMDQNIFGAVQMGYAVVQSNKLDDWRRFLKQGLGMHLDSESPDALAFRMDAHRPDAGRLRSAASTQGPFSGTTREFAGGRDRPVSGMGEWRK